MNTALPNELYGPDFALMLDRSLDLPALRRVVTAHVAAAVADPRIAQAERILIGGSGDSLFAARSVIPAFRRWTGLPAEAKTAMELARYEAPLLTSRDLVIGVSNSGSSSRAREAILLAKDRGAVTLGITGSLTGPLAAQADHVVHRPINDLPSLPAHYGRCFLNVAEYLAVLYALYAFALALGVKRGHITAAEQATQLTAIEAAIEAVPAISAAIEPAVIDLARHLNDIDTIWAIGAGPSGGTADYCAAKFHEQMPINGVACDLEEWAHLEYFLTLEWGARSVVMVIAPPGNSLDRAQELVTGIANAGGRAIVVTESPDAAFPEAAARFDLGHAMSEWISPILYHLPAQILVLHMAQQAKIDHIPRRRKDGTWLIAQGIVRPTIGDLG